MSFYKFLQISIALLFYTFIPSGIEGAVLYLEPTNGEYHQGETFIVEVRIDIENECINTVKADLGFSQDILEAVDFSQGDSILALWVKPPTIEQSAGLVSFIGGIPAGFCGRLPGDPGRPDLLGKIIFKICEAPQILTPSTAKIEFSDTSQVLLNDGFGTPAKLTLEKMTLEILPGAGEIPESEWEKELREDVIPPELFKIEINKDPSVFEGKYFISFLTDDKQTGIDYFEIKEGRKDWKKGDSPYLLEDQSLRSIIKVKAVDKAGNERIVEHPPTYKITWKDWLLLMMLILITGGIIWRIIRKYRKK